MYVNDEKRVNPTSDFKQYNYKLLPFLDKRVD